jgi:glycosyltransferase involved in cell wall biosynthesis
MKVKLYYITKTWLPSNTGGSQMRQKQVEILNNNGFNVVVVTPNYKSREKIITDNLLSFSYKFTRLYSIGQRVGIYEDYLDSWVQKTFLYLKDKIKKNDLIFATSGGELATFKLATLLKEYCKCKLIVNYRDPISYTIVNGLKVDNKFHISRERLEYKYIKDADIISTSSKSIQQNIINKFPSLKEKIINNYFGYMKKIDLDKYKQRDKKSIVIGYGGSFSTTQKPEILSIAYELIKDKSKIKISYIGNYSKYKPLLNYKNAMFNGPFSHKEFVKFMIENVDIGFVSLQNDYFGACVPSKIYEYINLGLPILAALPNGDAKSIIEDNGFGLCYKYDDFKGITNGIERFYRDKDFYDTCKQNILDKKLQWSMDSLFSKLICKIKEF